MSNAQPSGSRSRSRRRGRRRPRKGRGPRSSTPTGGTAARDTAKPEAEELPPKKVFIYTYTIRKGG
jgi:hypothetical protein